MKEGFSANKANVRPARQILTEKELVIYVFQTWNTPSKYKSIVPKYDIFPILLFYCTQHNHSNYKFYSNFTKIDLAQSTKVKVQNTVKTFP